MQKNVLDLSKKKPNEIVKYLQALMYARVKLHKMGIMTEVISANSKFLKKIV